MDRRPSAIRHGASLDVQRRLPPDLPVLGRSRRQPTRRPVRSGPAAHPVRVRGRDAPRAPRLPGPGPGFEYSRVAQPEPSWSDYAALTTARARAGHDPTTIRDRAVPGGGRHRRRPAGRLQLQLRPPRRARSGSIPTSASPRPTRSTSPAPTRTGRASSSSRSRPAWRRRGWAAARTSSPRRRRHHHAAVLAGGGPAEHPDRGEPGQAWPTRGRVMTSPLTPQAWANRIAIPLEFNPVGISCSINANAQQIIGGELAAPAVAELAAVPVQPARQDAVQLHPEQRRPGPAEPPQPVLRLGRDVGVLRSDRPDPGGPVEPGGLRAAHLVGCGGGVQHRTGPRRRSDGNPQPDELGARRATRSATSTSPRGWWPGC